MRRHGHVVRYRGLWQSFQLTHPRDIGHVLQTNSQNYRKGRSLRALRPLIGDGLLTSDGEFWRRQRRLAQPAFQRQRFRFRLVPGQTIVADPSITLRPRDGVLVTLQEI